MHSEWRAAILGSTPSVGVLSELPSKEVRKHLTDMLSKGPDSCFRDELTTMGLAVPSVEDILSSGCMYIIGAGGRIVGCAAVQHRRSPVFIYNVCVDRTTRGKGIGSLLMTHICQDHPSAELKVWMGNPKADRVISLYKSHGFKVTDREPNYLTMVRHADHISRF